jgi:hypothetical protein
VSDDVERTLADLEARLRTLQAQLDPGRAEEQRVEERPEPAPARAERFEPLAADPLDQFGDELRRVAHELVGAYDRVLARSRGRGRERRHRIVLEAETDIHGLAALARALEAAPGVASVELGAYAGGHASLVVELS